MKIFNPPPHTHTHTNKQNGQILDFILTYLGFFKYFEIIHTKKKEVLVLFMQENVITNIATTLFEHVENRGTKIFAKMDHMIRF